jgi:lipoate-protein ligase A
MRLIVDLDTAAPALGLAVDEALFESVRDEGEAVLRFWVNEPSVIIGRSQGIAAEVDLDRARGEGIPVLRRISGGGAVYHYPGNLNVSVILGPEDEAGSVEHVFLRLGDAIRVGLAGLPLLVDVSGNRLLIADQKLGGAAQARRRSCVLYHTTILVRPADRPIERLLMAHRPGYRADGVMSRPERTTTLTEALGRSLSTEEAVNAVVTGFAAGFRLAGGTVTQAERDRALWFADNKYGSSAWNASR